MIDNMLAQVTVTAQVLDQTFWGHAEAFWVGVSALASIGVALATLLLALVTVGSVVGPIMVSNIRYKEAEARKKKTSEIEITTICQLIEGELTEIQKQNVERIGAIGALDLLLGRALDPELTRHLLKGTFEELMVVLPQASSIIRKAQALVSSISIRAPVSVYEAGVLTDVDSLRLRNEWDQLKALSKQASPCIQMLRDVVQRIENHDNRPYKADPQVIDAS